MKVSYVLICFAIITLFFSVIMPTSITIARCPNGTIRVLAGTVRQWYLMQDYPDVLMVFIGVQVETAKR